MSNEEEQAAPVEIPFAMLSEEALRGVIDDFVLREGTEYGAVDVTLDRKREQVRAQLKSGKALVMFEPSTETCTIVLKNPR